MLHHLHTVYRPTSPQEAQARLQERGAYPLYGGGAYLLRLPLSVRRQVEAVVDLSALTPSHWQLSAQRLEVGSAVTAAQGRSISADVAAVINAELPRTLQNTLTLGDLLMECSPDSLIIAMLYGIGARVITAAHDEDTAIDMPYWCALSLEERRRLAILGAIVSDYDPNWRFAPYKISRTPSDAPIVGAVGFAFHGEPDPGAYAIVVGVLERPVRYYEGIASTRSDYKGSAAYRTAMARIAYEESVRRARQLAHNS
ncbi:MAG: FAD binding domain-containing protein [Chloroflexi bacterium]|jgi:CO/xanthine dehydrogenase FAD-binding subunit|nr:FAD binding domain-containing protein [Chloroflexota bacterium]